MTAPTIMYALIGGAIGGFICEALFLGIKEIIERHKP
jgi:hypothetical protein